MKISRIIVKDFQQFKLLDLDLTDPQTGQPLDKVCLIGRNGTGKSTLLRIVKENLGRLSQAFNHSSNHAQLHQPTFRRSRREFPAGFGEPEGVSGRRPEAAGGATDCANGSRDIGADKRSRGGAEFFEKSYEKLTRRKSSPTRLTSKSFFLSRARKISALV